MFNRVRNFIRTCLIKYNTKHDSILDSLADEIKQSILRTMPDDVVVKGYKFYSAGEEDRVKEAIFEARIWAATMLFYKE
jgi:hypothetical protein